LAKEEESSFVGSEVPTDWQDQIFSELSTVIHPDLNNDIVTLGYVKNLSLDELTRQVKFDVQLTTPACPIKEEFKTQCEELVNNLSWTSGEATVDMTAPDPARIGASPNTSMGLSQVKAIIAVSSCKGGVGKSTTAVNLAYSLKALGAEVGIFDADIYGPSLPTMVTPDNDAVEFVGRQIKTLEREGVQLMSFGYVNDGSAVMRGPMITQLLDQFLSLTYWGPLDYLILDMPPGTGDIQLTLSQKMNITAAVIVTTPQELSFVDVERGIEMFDTVNVPCISVVENMAYLEIEDKKDVFDEAQVKDALVKSLIKNGITEEKSTNMDSLAEELMKVVKTSLEDQKQNEEKQLRIFGQGHKRRLSKQWGIDHSFSIPLLDKIAANGDGGTPYVVEYPESPQAAVYKDLAGTVAREVVKLQYAQVNSRPTVAYNSDEHLLEISIGGDKNEIESGTLAPAELRRDCKCAACVEEFSGRQILIPESIPDSVEPLSMTPTGNYALSVDWSDGHKSLYPYKQIRSLLQSRNEENQKVDETITVST